MKLPALMDAVMPPCVFESGCPKYSRYWSLPIQADMLLDPFVSQIPFLSVLGNVLGGMFYESRHTSS